MSNEGSDYQAAAEAGLWVPPNAWGWKASRRDAVAHISVEGGADEVDCRIVLVIPRKEFPAGNLSVLWNGKRVRGLDLDGPAHVDPRSGKGIPTPHFQMVSHQETEIIEAIDLEHEGIRDLRTAFEWLLKRSGIEYLSGWIEVPLPVELLEKPAQLRRYRRRNPR